MDGRVSRYPDGSPVSDTQRAFLAPLAAEIASAKADLEAVLAETLMKAGNRELINGALDWRAHEALLKRHPLLKRDWSEYREQRIEHAGQVNHEHRAVRELPTTDLLELAGPDFAELVGPQ